MVAAAHPASESACAVIGALAGLALRPRGNRRLAGVLEVVWPNLLPARHDICNESVELV